jgi:hypothetical protein
MKLNKKNIPLFIAFLILGALIGSIFWEIIERILHLFPVLSDFTLTTGEPVVLLDIYVLLIGIRGNPGTFLGLGGGIFFFFKI